MVKRVSMHGIAAVAAALMAIPPTISRQVPRKVNKPVNPVDRGSVDLVSTPKTKRAKRRIKGKAPHG